MDDHNREGNNSNVSTKTSTYDSALKQLVNILKSKASDNLKQLEELWDSINQTTTLSDDSKASSKAKIRISPTPSSNSQSPVTTMSENSNDSTTSSMSLKRDFSKINSQTISSNNHVMKKAKLDISAPSKMIKSNKTNVQKTKKDTNLDMLDDFTCVVCKNFNQELNNKLVECRKCTSLYHQICHVPRIKNEEIDDKDFEECTSCKNGSASSDDEIANINSKSVPRITVRSPNSLSVKSSDSSPESSKNGSSKGLAGLQTKLINSTQQNAKSPTEQMNEKNKASNELFNLNKKKATTPAPTHMISKVKQSSFSASMQSSSKKSGLFNLSNGLNGKKSSPSSFSGLKDKKLHQTNPISISRSKIS